MRGEAGDRYLRFLREDAARRCTRRTGPASRATGEPELAAEVRRAAGDYARAARRVRAPRPRPGGGVPRPARGVELWTSARHPRRAAAAGHRAGAAPSGGLGEASHRGASGTGAAGSGSRSARTSPGSSASWPISACARSASTRPTSLGLGAPSTDAGALPGRHRRRAGGLADGAARVERRRRLPGQRRLPRLPPPHGARPRPWDNDGAPYDPAAAAAQARRHAQDFVAARCARARSRGRRALRAARSTPSCSATGGTRARWLARVLEQAPRGGPRAGHRSRRAGARTGRSERALRAVDLGRGQGPLHLGRARRWPTWPAPRARAELRTVRRRAAARPTPPWRARARAAGAPVERLGVHGHARARRPTTRASAWRATSRTLRRRARRSDRLRGRAGRPALRNLAPDARPGLAHRAVSMRVLILSWEYPPLDRGRSGAPRAQARREPRRARAWRCTCSPAATRRRPPRRRSDGVHRPPRARARAPARPGRVRHLDRAHERRHARRRRGAGRPLRLRPRARARLARRRRRRPPGQALPLPARGDDPRHRVRPPPGLGGQAPAVPHPRRRALDGQPRRARDHLLGTTCASTSADIYGARGGRGSR